MSTGIRSRCIASLRDTEGRMGEFDSFPRGPESETMFTRQFEVAKAIVAANDTSVLPPAGALVDAPRPVLARKRPVRLWQAWRSSRI
jgi:hypothetical protein